MSLYQCINEPPGSGIPFAGGLGQGCSGVFAAAMAPTNITIPIVSGTAQVGSLLAATTGTWNNSPTSFAFQWKSAGVNATGATATTNMYTPVSADIGNTLTVSVTATNSAGSSSAATSAATAAVIAGLAGMLNFSQASDSVLIGAVFA
jgi:hypothetical protein